MVMDGSRIEDLASMLATNTSRRAALKVAAARAASASGASRLGRQPAAAARSALDPVVEAGRRLTAAVDHEQVPLPTVRLPSERNDSEAGR
jgi:hypothetical protein